MNIFNTILFVSIFLCTGFSTMQGFSWSWSNFPSLSSGDKYSEESTETISLNRIENLSVSNQVGSIGIHVHNGNEIIVKSIKRSDDKDAFKKYDAEFLGQKSKRLEVSTRMHTNNVNGKMDYIISVPKNMSITVSQSTGSIDVKDISGSVHLDVSTGSIEVLNTDGDIDVKTSTGSIDIKKARKNVNAKVSTGSIDIELHKQFTGDSVHAKSSTGSIDLKIPNDLNDFTLETKVSLGSIETPYGQSSNGTFKTSRGNGNTNIRLKTSTGSINVEKN